jgi:hypothetical protein
LVRSVLDLKETIVQAHLGSCPSMNSEERMVIEMKHPDFHHALFLARQRLFS